ncbi:MAG: hypothetical protein J6S85_23360 [Methanobrevibacter sp.]|nr:hypothetical protein [Methanobrevibacter sp.]
MLSQVCLKGGCIQVIIDLVGCKTERKRNSQALKNPLSNGLRCTLGMVGEKESLERIGSNENIARVNVLTG